VLQAGTPDPVAPVAGTGKKHRMPAGEEKVFGPNADSGCGRRAISCYLYRRPRDELGEVVEPNSSCAISSESSASAIAATRARTFPRLACARPTSLAECSPEL
jgi:hypothetical protein